MTKANESAFPTQMWDEELKEATWLDGGLTKRELVAMMAMQGMLAMHGMSLIGPQGTQALAERATAHADALLKELERETK